jgi:hypothetical protein
MERYIRNKLGHVDDKVSSVLVNTVLAKASGIFLWVALVVKSLRERLEETHDLSILKEEINTLPDELEDLFRYLLNTLSKPARTTAYKTFVMLEALYSSSDEPLDLTLFAYSFLEDYAKDPEFAIQTPFQYASMNTDAQKSRIDQARKTLIGSTKGLVEAIDGSVKHIHRSISEFLERREVRDEMACHLQNFEAVDAVSQLLVGELRAKAFMPGRLSRPHCSRVVSCIVVMRMKFGADRAPYSFLESLGSVLIEHCGPNVTQYSVRGTTIYGIIWNISKHASTFRIQYREPKPHATRNFYVISPFHISALLGLEEYVAWKIHHDRNILNTDFETAVLVSIIESRLLHNFEGAKQTKQSTQSLESLLERGLSPQAVIHTTTAESSIWADNDRTVWENFVLLVALDLEGDGSFKPKESVGKALEKFLEYGADPSLQLSASPYRYPIGERGYQRGLEMRVGRNGGKILAYHRYRIGSVHSIFLKVGGISFRELMECLNFDNKESLLGLIDRNIKQQERRTDEGVTQEEHTWKRNAESTFTRESSSELTETRSWRLHTLFGLGWSKSLKLLLCKYVLTRI